MSHISPLRLLTSSVLKEMNNLPRLARIFIGNWGAACYSSSWFYPAADSSSDGWIRVTAESILRLTRAPAPGSDLRLIPSCGWLEFRWMDTSYSWLHHTDDSTSSGWIRLKADSIQRLTKTCGWLEFQKLHTSYSWFHPAADSMLRLTQVNRLDLTCSWLIL